MTEMTLINIGVAIVLAVLVVAYLSLKRQKKVAMVMVNTAMATMAITAFTLTPITATKMMTV
jgi:hypothetical protein